MEGSGSTIPDVPYSSCYPDKFSNVSILPVLRSNFLGKYFSECNAINNHKRMRQSDLLLEKYWVTQSGYFILVTAVALVMGITDANILF